MFRIDFSSIVDLLPRNRRIQMLQDEIRRLQALRERVESRLHAELQDFLQWAEGEHKARSKDGNDVTSSTAATETAKAKRSTEPDASAKITKTKKYKKSKKSKAHTTNSWSRSGKNYLLTCAHVDADKVPEGVRVETFADATVRACVDVDEYKLHPIRRRSLLPPPTPWPLQHCSSVPDAAT
jgi:hypothetical protein